MLERCRAPVGGQWTSEANFRGHDGPQRLEGVPQRLEGVPQRLEGVHATGGVCVEIDTPRGGEEEGKEEVLRRLVTPKGVGGLSAHFTDVHERPINMTECVH